MSGPAGTADLNRAALKRHGPEGFPYSRFCALRSPDSGNALPLIDYQLLETTLMLSYDYFKDRLATPTSLEIPR